ncbi:MAG: hypothetical protein KJ977_05190 [Candidatus Omnitrophica bacterium]|nr:hypothetical protein [Candidatus Omnitrophota bacterium]MBU2266417.1 hypothetical protein [Candidatus Omnitrophota bacterium]
MSKNDKKKLLMSWGSPQVFYETMIPLIPKLAENFSISIILIDYFTPAKTLEALDSMRVQGLIKEYWLVPSSKNILKHHFYIKSKLKTWRSSNFDVFLSNAVAQVFERYIVECVIPSHCVCVCFWAALGYPLYKRVVDPGSQDSFLSKVLRKTKQAKSFDEFFQTGKAYANKIFHLFLKEGNRFCSRIILPGLLVRKIFPLTGHVSSNQIAPKDNSGVFVFCDEVEAEEVRKLFKKAQAHVVKYPTQGNCRCNGNEAKKDKSAILLILSGFINESKLSPSQLEIIYRDIQIVLSESGARSVHLRFHPRDNSHWAYDLQDYLKSKGVNAICVGYDQPIREVMCDYLGMVGFASSALRDGRAACDQAFVIGFSAISKSYTLNPKAWFGNSEGIDWIEEDGTYDPVIFRRGKHVPSAEKSIDELLVELADRTN